MKIQAHWIILVVVVVMVIMVIQVMVMKLIVVITILILYRCIIWYSHHWFWRINCHSVCYDCVSEVWMFVYHCLTMVIQLRCSEIVSGVAARLAYMALSANVMVCRGIPHWNRSRPMWCLSCAGHDLSHRHHECCLDEWTFRTRAFAQHLWHVHNISKTCTTSLKRADIEYIYIYIYIHIAHGIRLLYCTRRNTHIYIYAIFSLPFWGMSQSFRSSLLFFGAEAWQGVRRWQEADFSDHGEIA